MTSLDELLLNMVTGIIPARIFMDRFSTRSDGALGKESGITPLRLFPARLTYLREGDATPSDGGMLPERMLPASIRSLEAWKRGHLLRYGSGNMVA